MANLPSNSSSSPTSKMSSTPQGSRASQVERQLAEQKASQELLDARSKDYHRLQRQKARKVGGTEARMMLALAFDWGEQYIVQTERGIVQEPIEESRLYLVYNFIHKNLQKLRGRLIHNGLQFGAQPDKRDPKALANAEVVEKLVLALDRKLKQPNITWEIVDWMLKTGVAFEYVSWMPNYTVEPMAQRDPATGELLFKDTLTGTQLPESIRKQLIGQGIPAERFELLEVAVPTGEVCSEVVPPLNVFIDQSVKCIEDLAPDQWVYIARLRTRGWIEETYEDANLEEVSWDREFKIVTTELVAQASTAASLYLKDMIPMVQGRIEEDDVQIAVVVDAWCPASKKNPGGRWVTFIPDKVILRNGPNVYPEIPIVDYHFEPVTTTFWTKDYVTDQIAPQRFFNRRISQLGEQSNATIYDNLLLGPTLHKENIPADKPGPIEGGLSDQGQPMVARLGAPQLPQWFMETVQLAQSAQDKIAGAQSLMEQEKFPGQLRGPMAVPLLQEINNPEWGPLFMHLAERMARAKLMRVNRVKQFYPPLRTLHYTDQDQRDEVLEFHNEGVLKAGTNFSIHVEPSSIIPEMRALREARVAERLQNPGLALLYTDSRTGQLDRTKIAQDLREGDSGRVDRESAARKFQQQLLAKLKL